MNFRFTYVALLGLGTITHEQFRMFTQTLKFSEALVEIRADADWRAARCAHFATQRSEVNARRQHAGASHILLAARRNWNAIPPRRDARDAPGPARASCFAAE